MILQHQLQPFILAFAAFAEAEYTHVLQCYQLADPEDDSQTDDEAVEAACDEALKRFVVSKGEVKGLSFDYLAEPCFAHLVFDWDEEQEKRKRSLVVRQILKASLHHHPQLGEVCRFLTSGTGERYNTPNEIDFRLDFARIGDTIKCIASWDLCHECYGTGFIDGYGTKQSPGLTSSTKVCDWIDDSHRDPDSEARRCRKGFDFNGGLLILDCGPPLLVQKFIPPAGAWMHQAVFES